MKIFRDLRFELVPKLKIASPILMFKNINLDTECENDFEKLGKVSFGITSLIKNRLRFDMSSFGIG